MALSSIAVTHGSGMCMGQVIVYTVWGCVCVGVMRVCVRVWMSVFATHCVNVSWLGTNFLWIVTCSV